MTKVMVFNFKTMQFEQASEEEGNDLLSLISAMNSECAAEQNMHADGACPKCGAEGYVILGDGRKYCNICKTPRR